MQLAQDTASINIEMLAKINLNVAFKKELQVNDFRSEITLEVH